MAETQIPGQIVNPDFGSQEIRGTTSWGTGRTLNLSGGTSSTPSGTGLTDKAIIQARGATVNTN